MSAQTPDSFLHFPNSSPDGLPSSAGQQLEIQGKWYEIQRQLGQGYTAVVYLARDEAQNEVVVKSLRPEAQAETGDYFRAEATLLKELQASGVTQVPQVLGEDAQHLVMEYINPTIYRPLDELCPLPELEALAVMEQALAVINKLHVKTARTYTDMQLKNFCWDRAQQKLKVLDWNHVSQIENFLGKAIFAGMVQRDLARLAAYLYRLLTNKGAFESGETAWQLAFRAGWEMPNINPWWAVTSATKPFFPAVSLATRQLVFRALHPNPERRFSGQDFQAAIRRTIDLLQNSDQTPLDLDSLGEQCRDSLKQAKTSSEQIRNLLKKQERQDNLPTNAEQPQHQDYIQASENLIQELHRTTAYLDMILRRPTEWGRAGITQKSLQELIPQSQTDLATVAQSFYDAGDYLTAAERWRQAAELSQQLNHWRWNLASQALAQSTAESNDQAQLAEFRQKLAGILAAINQPTLSKDVAQTQADQIAKLGVISRTNLAADTGASQINALENREKPPLEQLKRELEFWRYYQQAREFEEPVLHLEQDSSEKLELAAKNYREALNHLKDLDGHYQDLIRLGYDIQVEQIEQRIRFISEQAQELTSDIAKMIKSIRSALAATQSGNFFSPNKLTAVIEPLLAFYYTAPADRQRHAEVAELLLQFTEKLYFESKPHSERPS